MTEFNLPLKILTFHPPMNGGDVFCGTALQGHTLFHWTYSPRADDVAVQAGDYRGQFFQSLDECPNDLADAVRGSVKARLS